MQKIYFTCCFLCVVVGSLKAQNINRIEYFFNSDPGFGQAIALTGFTSAPDVPNFQASIDLSSVANGINSLYIRAEDDLGNWSLTNVIPFIKVDVSTYNIVRMEYYFNTDPGFGQATALTGFTSSSDVSNFSASIDLTSAPNGINSLHVRAEDDNGSWSITNVVSFIKTDINLYNIVSAEYFFNADPGFGNGISFSLPLSNNISNQPVAIDLTSVPLGINTLYVRTKDESGRWSLTNHLVFMKGTVAGDISSLEYFIDTDPGFGMAAPVSLVSAQDISNYTFDADVSGLTDGTIHNLFIRARDVDGVWSLTNVVSFTKMPATGVTSVADVSAEFTVSPNPATDRITLQSLSNKKMDKIEVIDGQGKLMQVKCTGSVTEKVIDVGMVNNGIYFIRITSEGNTIYKKVVKD